MAKKQIKQIKIEYEDGSLEDADIVIPPEQIEGQIPVSKISGLDEIIQNTYIEWKIY